MMTSGLAHALKMAATAAILLLLPGVALAGVCDQGSFNFADHLPVLDTLLRGQSDGEQFRKFFTPESVVTVAILIWLLASNGTRATIAAICWFACLAIYHAIGYLSIDLADPYYQAAITEGCVENSPRHVLSNLGFAAIAGLLTWQRLRRQQTS
jgi:hypothetical protein